MSEIFEVKTDDGTVVKGNYWPAEDPVAILDVITGMDEYSLRYEPFALRMNEHGISVRVMDALGQGLNVDCVEDQEIWPKDGFRINVDAINEMNKLSREDGLPVIQMGHSMGSFMIQSCLSRYPHSADKTIIMGSNGGQASLMKSGYAMARLTTNSSNWNKHNKFMTMLSFGPYVKSVKDRKTHLDWLSYNEENVQKYIEDPWCGHPNSGGFWLEFMKGMSTLWDGKTMSGISEDEKILIVSGKDDPVGQMGKGVKWLYKKYRLLGIRDVKLKIYDHMRHEILNEENNEQVYQDILDFILKE